MKPLTQALDPVVFDNPWEEREVSMLESRDRKPPKRRGGTASPKTDKIKAEAEAVTYFSQWRDAVLLHVGLVLGIMEPTKQRQQGSEPSRLGLFAPS